MTGNATLGANGWIVGGLGDAAFKNFLQSNTKTLAAAVGRAGAGTARARLVCIGDSYPAGYTAGGTDDLVGARPFAFPSQLAKLLTAQGLNARADYAVGDGGTTTLGLGDALAPVIAYDARLSAGGAAKLLNGFPSLGGSMWWLQGPGDKVTFTPGKAFDTVDLLTANNTAAGANGQFAVSFDGGTTHAYTVSNSADVSVQHQTYVVPGGVTANAVTLISTSGLSFFPLVGTRLAASPGLEIINCGIAGGEVATMAATPTTAGDANSWSTRACVKALCDGNALNVILVNGWFNDRTAGQSVPQIQSSLSTMFNEFKNYGDVIYTSYAPLSNASIPQADYDAYTDAAISVALGAGIPVVDLREKLNSYAVNSPLGIYGDGLHLQSAGHAMAARIYEKVIGMVM